MTERWKRELSKIDEIEPEEGLLDRARLGPTRGALQPSRASRVGTVVLAFAAVALAGVLLVRAFGWPGGTTQVASDVTPTAVIDAGPMPWMAVSKENPAVTLEALYTGKLFERNGCLMMGDGQTLPTWPTQFWMMQSDGKTFVMDEQGNAVAALGDEMRMGGGLVPWRNDIEGLQQTLAEPIPQACLKDLRNVWMVGETHPLAPAALTPEQQRALWDVAQRLAKDLTSQPFTARAVVGTPEQIMGMRIGAFGGAIDPVPGSRWALVQLEGDFTHYRPGSTEDLKGSALWFVSYLSDPIVPNPTDWGILAEPVDLTQLGDVVELGAEANRDPPLEVTYGAPSVGKISCTADGVVLHTPVVAAQRDGVTFDIDNAAGFESVGWYPVDSDATWGATIGRERRVVWGQMPPGRYTVGCGPESANNANDLVGATAIVEVTDPASYWHPYELDCVGEKKATSTASYLADKVFTSRSEDDQFVYSKDFTYEGESTIRSRVPGILDSDILDYRGYPEGKRVMGNDSFRVVRDGRVVAGVAVLHRSPDSLALWVEACPSSGIHAET